MSQGATISESTELACDIRGYVQRWGGAFMTAPEMAEVEQEAGLGSKALYLRGRSAVLGDPAPAVVADVFGIFPGWLFDLLLPAAVQAISAPDAVEAYRKALGRWARARLGAVEEPGRLAALLRRLVDCADPSGLALFSGWRSVAWPSGEPERVAHGLMMLREYRGGLHFAALRSVGLSISEAVVADPEGGRGRLLRTAWQPEAADELIARASAVPDLHERWRRGEGLTDERMGELLAAALDGAEQVELRQRLRVLDEVAGRA